MGRRGPQKEPTKLKLIKGNPGKQKLNPNEPEPKVISIAPDPPDWVCADGRTEWRSQAQKLASLGLLSEVDLSQFASYCHAFGRMVECAREVEENRPGKRRPKEEETAKKILERLDRYTLATRLEKTYRADAFRLASAFGLTPSARTGLHVDTKQDPSEALEVLLSGKGS